MFLLTILSFNNYYSRIHLSARASCMSIHDYSFYDIESVVFKWPNVEHWSWSDLWKFLNLAKVFSLIYCMMYWCIYHYFVCLINFENSILAVTWNMPSRLVWEHLEINVLSWFFFFLIQFKWEYLMIDKGFSYFYLMDFILSLKILK